MDWGCKNVMMRATLVLEAVVKVENAQKQISSMYQSYTSSFCTSWKHISSVEVDGRPAVITRGFDVTSGKPKSS